MSCTFYVLSLVVIDCKRLFTVHLFHFPHSELSSIISAFYITLCDLSVCHSELSIGLTAGEEEGRQVGTSSRDPSRRRSGQLMNPGITRQESPAANDSVSKDAMVSC